MNTTPKTCSEMLSMWDAGGHFMSANMGGSCFSDLYEYAIQMLAMELVRDHIDDGIQIGDEFPRKWGDETIAKFINEFPLNGLSGEQAMAAKNLAVNLLAGGPESIPPERGFEIYKRTEPELQVMRRKRQEALKALDQ